MLPSVSPTFNTTEISAMSDERKLRNFCRQLEWEAVEWHRSFSYRGNPVSRGATWWSDKNSSLTLRCWGGKNRQTVQLYYQDVAISSPIRVKAGSAGTIYLAIAEAQDRIDAEALAD